MLTLIKLLLLGIFRLRTTELDRDEDSYRWKRLICLIASSIWWSKMVFWRHHSRVFDLFFALCSRILQAPRLMSILCSPYRIEAALLWVTPGLGKRCACAHDTALSELWGLVFKGFWKCLFLSFSSSLWGRKVEHASTWKPWFNNLRADGHVNSCRGRRPETLLTSENPCINLWLLITRRRVWGPKELFFEYS